MPPEHEHGEGAHRAAPPAPDPAVGLRRGTVELAASHAAWPRLAAALLDRLLAALGALAIDGEHVGSTAVPGLVAKPILDLAILLAPDADEREAIDRLEREGTEFRGDQGADGGLVFVLEPDADHRWAHVHVVRHGDPQWDRYLAFRDRLRSDPGVAEAYAAHKRELAARFTEDRESYTEGKAALIQRLLSA